MKLTQAFDSQILEAAEGWAECWQLPQLAAQIEIRFSPRMFRCVGRSYPLRQLISLAAAVTEFRQAMVCAVLCHEMAHLAVYQHYGRKPKPHGQEWQRLMRLAGYEPRVRFDDPQSLAILEKHKPASANKRYHHQCPRCSRSRLARQRMSRWRCGVCYEMGYDGRLVITTV